VTENELSELGQTVQKILPAKTTWLMLLVPSHDRSSYEPDRWPVQTVGNVDEKMTQALCEAVVEMFEEGTHWPVFARPVLWSS
jgi:hypothetical protein